MSVSALLGPDGSAIFTPTAVNFSSPSSPTPYLTGTKGPSDTLWSLDIPPITPPTTALTCIVFSPPGPELTVTHTALLAKNTVPSIRNLDDAGYVAYQHRAFGSPAISTFIQAIRHGWIKIRRLTASLVLRNPPLSVHTAYGHLDAQSKNAATTRTFPSHVLAATRSQLAKASLPPPHLPSPPHTIADAKPSLFFHFPIPIGM